MKLEEKKISFNKLISRPFSVFVLGSIASLGLDMIKKNSAKVISIAVKVNHKIPYKLYYLKIIDSKYLKRISYLDTICFR